MHYWNSYLRIGISFSQSNEYICSQRDGTCLTTLSTLKRELQLEGTEVLIQGLLKCTFYKMVYRRGILTMYPRLLQHHGRQNTREQGTGDRGQGNPAERASALFAFVLWTKARARQKWRTCAGSYDLWVDHSKVTQEKRHKRCNEKEPWRPHSSPNKLT